MSCRLLALFAVVLALCVPAGANFAIFQVTSNAYPASVVQNGLQAVWNLRNAGAVGPRSAITNTLGVTTFPAGCGTYSSGTVIITTSCTLSNWDFTAATVAFVVRGNSTVVTIQDSLFFLTCGGGTPTYGIEVSDNSTTPTVHLNYDKFDGNQCSSNATTAWSASVISQAGATVTIDHSWFVNTPFDVQKCTNANLTMTNNYIRMYGWNVVADADSPQNISCVSDIENNLYDISDGAALSQAHNFPGEPPNSAVFDTLDVPSSQNGTMTFKNNILYGYGLIGSTCCTNLNPGNNGTPFNSLLLCDNHTVLSTTFTLTETIQNNVIQKANTGYWTHGGNITSAACIASWTTNIDYDTSATIAAPSF